MNDFLSVHHLKAGYGRAQVLFDMSFAVGAGEVVTLLGRNGMGRSTTIKCLFGMLGAHSGEIWVGGRQVRREPSHRIDARGSRWCRKGARSSPSSPSKRTSSPPSARASRCETSVDTRAGLWALPETEGTARQPGVAALWRRDGAPGFPERPTHQHGRGIPPRARPA